MKNVKGWDDEEDNYALFITHTNKKVQKTVQRKMFILWRVWTQSSGLPQQEKQSK